MTEDITVCIYHAKLQWKLPSLHLHPSYGAVSPSSHVVVVVPEYDVMVFEVVRGEKTLGLQLDISGTTERCFYCRLRLANANFAKYQATFV